MGLEVGTTALSPFNFKLNLLRGGTGTADHLTLLRLSTFLVFFGSGPKGDEVLQNTGGICPSVRPSIHPSPSLPHPQGFVSFGAKIQIVWPKSKLNDPNPAKMGQIQAKWLKTKQNEPNLAGKPEFWPEPYHFGPLNLDSGSQNSHPSLGEHRGNLSVRTSIRPSVSPPLCPTLRALSPLGPKSKLYGLNPS